MSDLAELPRPHPGHQAESRSCGTRHHRTAVAEPMPPWLSSTRGRIGFLLTAVASITGVLAATDVLVYGKGPELNQMSGPSA